MADVGEGPGGGGGARTRFLVKKEGLPPLTQELNLFTKRLLNQH